MKEQLFKNYLIKLHIMVGWNIWIYIFGTGELWEKYNSQVGGFSTIRSSLQNDLLHNGIKYASVPRFYFVEIKE